MIHTPVFRCLSIEHMIQLMEKIETLAEMYVKTCIEAVKHSRLPKFETFEKRGRSD